MDLETSEEISFILQNTEDGDKLASCHLRLVESAANGNLTPKGIEAFKKLYQDVKEGTYRIPWFCGIENLIRDQEGFVFWKGRKVEHYDHDRWGKDGWEKQMMQDAKGLAERCEKEDREQSQKQESGGIICQK